MTNFRGTQESLGKLAATGYKASLLPFAVKLALVQNQAYLTRFMW